MTVSDRMRTRREDRTLDARGCEPLHDETPGNQDGRRAQCVAVFGALRRGDVRPVGQPDVARIATTSPSATPLDDLDAIADLSPVVTMRSSTLSSLHDVDAARARARFAPPVRHEQRAASAAATTPSRRGPASALRPGWAPPLRPSARADRLRSDGETNRTVPANSGRIGVDREPHRLADGARATPTARGPSARRATDRCARRSRRGCPRRRSRRR